MNRNAAGDEDSWRLRDVVDGMIGEVGAWPGYDLIFKVEFNSGIYYVGTYHLFHHNITNHIFE